jgi:hypothetical protein
LQTSFWDGYTTQHVLQEEGEIQVLVDLAPSSQTVQSLFRTSWLAKLALKKLTKSGFKEFALVEKFAQLLLMKCIRQK